MTVRVKSFFVIALMTAFALAATYILSRVILEPNSNTQEDMRVRDNIRRIMNAVDQELTLLDRLARNSAARDDTYRFIRGRNPEYVRSDIADSTLRDNDLQAVVYLDASGEVVLAKAYDPAAGRATVVPPGLLQKIVPGSRFMTRDILESGVPGFLVLPEGFSAVTARPIAPSDGRGPAVGTLVIARRFDEQTILRLGRLTSLPLRFDPPAGPNLPAGIRSVLARPEGGQAAVAILDDRRIAGAALFKDVFGAPAFVLSIEIPRLFHEQFLQGLRYFLVALSAYSLLNLLLGQVLMDRLVTRRVHALSEFMTNVETSGRLDTRVAARGRDEVTSLAAGLNAMLDALERQVSTLKAAEDAVKRSEIKYRGLFEASTDAIFLQTLDGKILDCNRTASEMFGYPKDDLLDLTTADLVPNEARPEIPTRIAMVSERGRLMLESVHKRKNGTVFPCEISMLTTNIGRATLLVVFVHDTTERKLYEERLKASVREKEVLLREVHHRVKNNMQIISSLFNLQADGIRDAAALAQLRECQGRIRTMSLVHEKLYQAKDMARIHFGDYIKNLALFLFHFWQVNEDRIKLDLRVEDLVLDINTAIPCGLIINELVSNALEHAFPNGRVGTVRIGLRAAGRDRFELVVEDDGVGIPNDIAHASSESLGLQLVTLLINQLDGTAEITGGNGTRCVIGFRELKYKSRF